MRKALATVGSLLSAVGSVVPGAGVAVLVAVAVAAAGFVVPAERLATSEQAYVHEGIFSYATDSVRGPAYPDGLGDGDPVFTRVMSELDVRFDYELSAEGAVAAAGSYRIDVELGDATGWTHRLPLVGETSFDGERVSADGTVDLARISAAFQGLEEATGLAPANPTVTLVADVDVDARVGGAALAETFTASVPFAWQPLMLRVAADDDTPLVTTLEATTSRAGREANLLPVGPVDVPVPALRWLMVAAAMLLLAGAVPSVLRHRRLAAADEVDRIAARHGLRLLPVVDLPHTASLAVDVADFSALQRIAEHHDQFVLHRSRADEDTYVVDAGSYLYRYVAPARAQAAATAPPAPGSGADEPVGARR